MPKPGTKKLGKLRLMLKRLPSLSGRANSTTAESHNRDTCQSRDHGLHPVYVGKSRRRYLIASELVGHPLLQVLLQRSSARVDGGNSGGSGGGGDAVVGCEVVLFEHLLWMLENGEGESESVDELVEYYVC